MKTIEDFTGIAIGAATPEGPVSICPSCGRAGVREDLPDGVCEFVHVETEEVMGDGMRIEPVDWCPVLTGADALA